MYPSVITPNTRPGSSLSRLFCAYRVASDDSSSVLLVIPVRLASLVVAFIFLCLPASYRCLLKQRPCHRKNSRLYNDFEVIIFTIWIFSLGKAFISKDYL